MYNEVSNWLDQVLQQDIFEEVVAFCFNLYDDGDNNWSMELVGTEQFDVDDEDWPCEEISDFGTREGKFSWSEGTEWSIVLEEMVFVLQDYLEKGSYAGVLKSKAGVGVGFVDGNVEVIYIK